MNNKILKREMLKKGIFSLTILLLTACTQNLNSHSHKDKNRYLPKTSKESYHKLHYLDTSALSKKKKRKIIISLENQKAIFIQENQKIGFSMLNSGKKGFKTPKGVFKIYEKDKDHQSSIYGQIIDEKTQEILNPDANIQIDAIAKGHIFENADMPNFMRFHGAIGMHQGFIKKYPSSHGCIRLPKKISKQLFENFDLGTAVIVK